MYIQFTYLCFCGHYTPSSLCSTIMCDSARKAASATSSLTKKTERGETLVGHVSTGKDGGKTADLLASREAIVAACIRLKVKKKAKDQYWMSRWCQDCTARLQEGSEKVMERSKTLDEQ